MIDRLFTSDLSTTVTGARSWLGLACKACGFGEEIEFQPDLLVIPTWIWSLSSCYSASEELSQVLRRCAEDAQFKSAIISTLALGGDVKLFADTVLGVPWEDGGS